MCIKKAIGISIIVTIIGSGLAVAQQVRTTQTATMKAKQLTFGWGTNIMDFSGDCHLTIDQGYNAEMKAPSMQVRLNNEMNMVDSLVAKGPVRFVIITAPDASGVRRQIECTAQKEATYNEQTQIIKLIGNATAAMKTVGGSAAETVNLTSDTITANLKTETLTVEDVNMTIQRPLNR